MQDIFPQAPTAKGSVWYTKAIKMVDSLQNLECNMLKYQFIENVCSMQTLV